jgi:hypothetical protein
MAVFINRNFTRRNYDCTNIVAVEAAEMPTVGWSGAPADYWVAAPASALAGLEVIGSFAGMRFWGHL